MATQFVRAVPIVRYSTIKEANYSFSAAQYRGFSIRNKTRKKVRDFLDRALTAADLGEEVGSVNYVEQSPKCFLKTKCLQSHSFIPDVTRDAIEWIRPTSFVDCRLSEGDVIISKDSNIGEAAILDRDYPDTMLSGALYKLPLGRQKYYLFAFLKHRLFKEQLDFMTPKGSVIRHCKTLFLDCEIPLPNRNEEKTIRYVESIVRAVITKERLIAQRHAEILRLIKEEIDENHGSGVFAYRMPRYVEMSELGRMDSKPYCQEFQESIFRIRNYKYGCKTIRELGFTLSRGQNLQVSNIGGSVYSDSYHDGFYTLMLPKFLSRYGTCEKVEYLGNPRTLKTLKVGDLIFGAEGFEKGRSIVVVENSKKTITNIHGITIQNSSGVNICDAVFVKCFLDYLRSIGMIDMLAVGGNGGSLAQKYWDVIPFPLFPEAKKHMIAELYHNGNVKYDTSPFSGYGFDAKNLEFDSRAGVLELDNAVKRLKSLLDEAIQKIANDEDVCFNGDDISLHQS